MIEYDKDGENKMTGPTQEELELAKEDGRTLIRVIIRRILEVILAEMVISALGTCLIYFEIINNAVVTLITAAAVTAIYFVWTVRCLYKFRVVFDGRRDYFLINIPIYGALFAGAIVTGIFKPEPVYSFLFMPFKLLRVAARFCYAVDIWRFPGAGRMTHSVSAIIMSIVFAIPVIIIPFYITTDRKMYIKEVEENEIDDLDEFEDEFEDEDDYEDGDKER